MRTPNIINNKMSLDSINSDLNALFLVCAMLCIVLVSVVYFFTAFCQGKIRSRVFNAEFMSQFDTEHQEAFGKPAPVGGYPDCGNGFYQSEQGSPLCVGCIPGRTAISPRMSTCSICSKGKYQDQIAAQVSCDNCPEGEKRFWSQNFDFILSFY